MRVEVAGSRELRFDDGALVRAASAVAPFSGGWLIAQDDATHAAWRTETSITPVRVFPAVDGHEVFGKEQGTKHLKPDVEAACEIDRTAGVLLLGSGSTSTRMRASLVHATADGPRHLVGDLSRLYARVADVLGVPLADLNLEGACRLGDVVRWFARGNRVAGVPSASVDVEVRSLLEAVTGARDPREVEVRSPLRYELGEAEGVALAVTDAVALPDGRVLVSAAAEDSPNAVDDGPVVATALALLAEGDVVEVTPLPEVEGRPHKVEGLAMRESTATGVRLLAVIDDDDDTHPSVELDLHVTW